MVKNNPLRDKLEDDTLDLSLSQLEEVPVRDIALLPKGTTLDLSNNLLISLPDNFATLTHIVKLDLSKNQLRELPEYFGHLKSIRHLDLYSNQLERLPVSFCQLKSLRWLDLKGNPLVPALQKAAGDCISASDCQKCAKSVVNLMMSMQSQMERERQKQYLVEAAKQQEEDAVRERERLEKKAAKEKRREEAKGREQEKRKRHNMDISSGGSSKHEMEQQRPNNGSAANGKGAHGAKGKNKAPRGWCSTLIFLFLGMALVSVATGISMLWIYTGGKLDPKSIDRALPLIRRDVDKTILSAGRTCEYYLEGASMALGPYVEDAAIKFESGWAELCRRTDLVAIYVKHNLGPYFCSFKRTLFEYWTLAQIKAAEGWVWLRPQAQKLWTQLRPHFEALGAMVLAYVGAAVEWVQKNGPVYAQLAYETCAGAATAAANTVDGWING